MRNILKTIVCFLVAVLISFGGFSSQAWARSGGFYGLCANSIINSHYLISDCLDNKNQVNYSVSIDLDPYINNSSGELQWEPKNYYETCTNYGLDGAILNAQCSTPNGGLNQTAINLNDHIASVNGELVYN